MKLEFSAGGIIFKNTAEGRQFALILDSYNKWTFPKGRIEKGEKPERAASREVGEELGLENLKIIKLLDKIDYWFRLKGELIHKYVYFYLMEAGPKTILKAQEEEVQEAKWFSPQEAMAILGYKKDSLKLLKSAFDELEVVI